MWLSRWRGWRESQVANSFGILELGIPPELYVLDVGLGGSESHFRRKNPASASTYRIGKQEGLVPSAISIRLRNLRAIS